MGREPQRVSLKFMIESREGEKYLRISFTRAIILRLQRFSSLPHDSLSLSLSLLFIIPTSVIHHY